jgi:hypothetical protein
MNTESQDAPVFSGLQVAMKNMPGPNKFEAVAAYMRTVSPDRQLANIGEWNKARGWRFSDGELAAAGEAVADLPDYTRRGPRAVLVPYLDSVGRTFEELWAVASAIHTGVQREEAARSDDAHLGLIDELTHEPGLRWELLTPDPGATYQQSPADCRGPDSAHAGVLALACHYPAWAYMLGSRYAPSAYLAGYRARPSATSEWSYVPLLTTGWFGRTVRLSIVPTSQPNHYNTASPIRNAVGKL